MGIILFDAILVDGFGNKRRFVARTNAIERGQRIEYALTGGTTGGGIAFALSNLGSPTLPMAVDGTASSIVDRIRAALGESHDQIAEVIFDYASSNELPGWPKELRCPDCGCTDLDEFAVIVTVTASHEIKDLEPDRLLYAEDGANEDVEYHVTCGCGAKFWPPFHVEFEPA